MAHAKRPAQHNDSVSEASKRADQGGAIINKGTSTPPPGRGVDERGTYGKSVADPENERSVTDKNPA